MGRETQECECEGLWGGEPSQNLHHTSAGGREGHQPSLTSNTRCWEPARSSPGSQGCLGTAGPLSCHHPWMTPSFSSVPHRWQGSEPRPREAASTTVPDAEQSPDTAKGMVPQLPLPPGPWGAVRHSRGSRRCQGRALQGTGLGIHRDVLTGASCLALIPSNTLIKRCEGQDGRIQPNEVCWEDIPGAWHRDPCCSNAFSPCVLLLPSAPEPRPPHCAHGLVRISAVAMTPALATAQELQSSSCRPTQPGLGPCRRRALSQEPAQRGQADPSCGCRGEELPLLCFYPTRCWAGCKGLGQPTSGSRPHPEPGGVGVDHSSLLKSHMCFLPHLQQCLE